ncbi:uncharacterized protein LOC124170221 isoform X3 [Ischnura elegans]|nr:uncharacterized protein LOC124170221 isoform X3 [Ischnura elegans]
MGRGKRKRVLIPISSESEDEENTPLNHQKVLPDPPRFNEVDSCCRKERARSVSGGTDEQSTSETPRGKRNLTKFEEEVLRGLSFLKRTVKDVEERLKAVEECQRQLSADLKNGRVVPSTSTSRETMETLNGFPLESMEELNEMEMKLMDSSYKVALIEELSLIGGSSAKDFLVRVMKTLISDSLAGEFSWLGFKKKRPFSQLKLKEVINGAVRISKWGEESQVAIANHVQEWLKHGKFRHERKSKKDALEKQL